VIFVASFRDDCQDSDEKEIGSFGSSAWAKSACDRLEATRAHPGWVAPHMEWSLSKEYHGEVADGCDGSLYLVLQT
jgi:hypothetical protein